MVESPLRSDFRYGMGVMRFDPSELVVRCVSSYLLSLRMEAVLPRQELSWHVVDIWRICLCWKIPCSYSVGLRGSMELLYLNFDPNILLRNNLTLPLAHLDGLLTHDDL
jgi:hypothetical protein